VGVGVTAGIISKLHIEANTTDDPLPEPTIVNDVKGLVDVMVNKPLPIPKVGLSQYMFGELCCAVIVLLTILAQQ
jgi:hypothetical protein